MEWYEFYDIAERYIDLINPLSREKVIEAGRHLHLSEGQRVIDWLRKTQDEHFRFGREHLGWALSFLNPIRYM